MINGHVPGIGQADDIEMPEVVETPLGAALRQLADEVDTNFAWTGESPDIVGIGLVDGEWQFGLTYLRNWLNVNDEDDATEHAQ